MSNSNEKYSPNESGKKDSPLGRIIITIAFVLLCSLIVYKVYDVYKTFLMPLVIILTFGIILCTVWIKSLYIYRYLLPAMLIIAIFTAYPIVYTIYIAFTNFGTGHMQTSKEAKEILITKVWDVDYSKQPLYAEFFLKKDKKFNDYISEYKKERDVFLNDNFQAVEELLKEPIESYLFDSTLFSLLKNQEDKDFVKSMYNFNAEYLEYSLKDNIEKSDIKKLVKLLDAVDYISADFEDDWIDTKLNSIINKYYANVKRDDFSLLLYNKKNISLDDFNVVLSDSIEYKVLQDEVLNKLQNPADKVYILSKYVPDAKKTAFTLNETDNLELSKIKGIFDSVGFIDPNFKHVLSDDVKIYYYQNSFKEIKEASIEDLNTISEKYFLIGDYVYQRENLEKAPKLSIFLDVFEKYYIGLREETPIKFQDVDYLLEQSNEFFVKKHSFSVVNDNFFKLEINSDQSLGDYTIPVFEDNKYGSYVLTQDNKKVEFWKEYSISDFEFNYGMTLEKDSLAEDHIMNRVDAMGIMDKINNVDTSSILNKRIKDVSSTDLKNIKKSLTTINKDISEINKDMSKIRSEYISEGIKEIQENSFINDDEKKDQIKILKRSKFAKIEPIKVIKIEKSNISYDTPAIEPGYMVTVGFNNFIKIFTSKNITTPFFKVFIWTIIWALVSVLSSFAMGLALALVFNSSNLKGKYFYRTIFILPYAIPGFVSILMWQGFLNEDFGVINKAFNIHVPWITSSGAMAKVSVLIVNLWLSFPYFMLICLGALQSIDASMYEAADVDGASRIQQFTLITLPLLLLALGPMLVGSFAFAFNNFAGIYLLTSGGPVMAAGVLPGHTDILISYTYKLAFGEQNKDYGLASSIAIIVFLIIGTITFLQFKFTGTFKEVDNA